MRIDPLHFQARCRKRRRSLVLVFVVFVLVKERQDITGLNCIKGATGKVIVDDKGIKDSWKEYMEKNDE